MHRWESLHDLLRSRSATFGMALIVVVLLVALAGPALAPHDPLKPVPLDRLQGPSQAHPFGTDSLGRDILSRVIYGARISILIGLISVSISLVPGTLLGLISGYFGGRIDSLIMRLMDMLLA
ncbi:MAG: ABC transporter permease, partial [Desulfobacterales bacterium]|nr:ABC transporter permease [Desulfobacterales bacterium]